MKKILIAALLAISATGANANYRGSYDAGGCNASASWSCPQPKGTDEGLGGTGGGSQ